MDSIDYKKLYKLQDEVLDEFEIKYQKLIEQIALS